MWPWFCVFRTLKTHITYSVHRTKHALLTKWINRKETRSWLAYTRFAALDTFCTPLLRVLVSSSCYLRLLWLVKVSTLVQILWFLVGETTILYAVHSENEFKPKWIFYMDLYETRIYKMLLHWHTRLWHTLSHKIAKYSVVPSCYEAVLVLSGWIMLS